MRGFSSIGLVSPKDKANIGSVLRAARCYNSSLVVLENSRAPVKVGTDTTSAWKHIPIIRVDDMFDAMPYGSEAVAVDLVDGAYDLRTFKHPNQAFYIFGPEDGTLNQKHLDRCKYKVMIPTKLCMNLAATVNVVLYDRLCKGRK